MSLNITIYATLQLISFFPLIMLNIRYVAPVTHKDLRTNNLT